MSKFSNIYDIDGNIIHKSGDGPYTVEQTEKLVDELTKKVQENPDNKVYKVYLNNAQSWLYKLYNEMSREELINRMSFIETTVEEAKKEASAAETANLNEINNIIDEFKKQYELEGESDGGSVVEEMERPVKNDDTPKETVMDEYVDFEES